MCMTMRKMRGEEWPGWHISTSGLATNFPSSSIEQVSAFHRYPMQSMYTLVCFDSSAVLRSRGKKVKARGRKIKFTRARFLPLGCCRPLSLSTPITPVLNSLYPHGTSILPCLDPLFSFRWSTGNYFSFFYPLFFSAYAGSDCRTKVESDQW